MIQLQDKETGNPIGMITETQLQFLIDQMEEESSSDQDYYIDRDTLDAFAEAGAEAGLMDLLRSAMGDREDMEIRWSRK